MHMFVCNCMTGTAIYRTLDTISVNIRAHSGRRYACKWRFRWVRVWIKSTTPHTLCVLLQTDSTTTPRTHTTCNEDLIGEDKQTLASNLEVKTTSCSAHINAEAHWRVSGAWIVDHDWLRIRWWSVEMRWAYQFVCLFASLWICLRTDLACSCCFMCDSAFPKCPCCIATPDRRCNFQCGEHSSNSRHKHGRWGVVCCSTLNPEFGELETGELSLCWQTCTKFNEQYLYMVYGYHWQGERHHLAPLCDATKGWQTLA